LIATFINRTFAALQFPNYRLWFTGQLISLFGTWMQSTAQGFLIFELTGSPAYLGYVGFAAGIPTWLFTLYGGVIADRLSRRRLLLITQTIMMILAIILALLTFTHQVEAWHIILLAFFLGCANAFDAPARQAFVTDLVDHPNLTNAIALNSTMFNAGTVLGPALAGLTYAAFGPQWCFTINAISFLAVIVALLRMDIPPVIQVDRSDSVVADARKGLRYVVNHPIIRLLVLNMGIVSLFGLGFITLMPAWAVNVLNGDATTNGFMLSARGLGALAGALMIASFGQFHAKGRLLSIGSFVLPISLLIFSTLRQLPISLLILFSIGWGFMVMANMSNALVQTHVIDALRGRVMSIYTLIFFGLMPIGALINGTIANQIGPPLTVQINAFILLAFSTILVLRAPGLRKLE